MKRSKEQFVWGKKSYDINEVHLVLDGKLSPVILRPDFEEQYEGEFLHALSLFHKCRYTEANDIVQRFLNRDDGIAARTSFKVLNTLIELYKGQGPPSATYYLSIPRNLSLHVEVLIDDITRYWQTLRHIDSLSYDAIHFDHVIEDLESRKTYLSSALTTAMSQLRDWIPMPPVEDAKLTDINVSINKPFTSSTRF